jgi:lipoate-protein ligase A
LTPPADDPFPPPVGCRLLGVTYPGIAENLALDEALLVAAEERSAEPVVRVWEPDHLAVVMGASCRRLDEVDVAACETDGVAVARRSSGGGTVVVGPGALNLAVVLPADAAPGLHAVDLSQAFVLERVARSIRRLGPPVEVRGHGDLTLGGRKFAGSAQRRLRRHFLVHLSLLYRFPVGPIVRYTRHPRREPDYRAGRGHEDFLTNLDLPRAAVLAAVCAPWVAPGTVAEPGPVPEDLVRQLAREKFGAPSWVERL